MFVLDWAAFIAVFGAAALVASRLPVVRKRQWLASTLFLVGATIVTAGVFAALWVSH